MKTTIKTFTTIALGFCISAIIHGAYTRAALLSGMAALISVNLLLLFSDEKSGDKK